ncbi:hypothetical protein SPI_05789 [Niveomyces insectorum RCEF 264]|uniref:DUF7053 domain-containing protein n=1 Tax=Niveomyces insectorum RCEF 264 TaxID=1081102 RepID=A0A167SFX7_9HYPO|nr:hypothetical protein SPI_05789 [Niveomyces insectorum RCEF 264]
MSLLKKKELVTIVTPIPGFIPRQLAIDILHSHGEIITLNPLVLDHKPIKAPRDAASDEYYATWYEIIERIQYVPGLGRMGSGKIAFNACFHNMPWGVQAHIYAPMGVDLRYKYRIGGNQPGVEPPEALEMGLMALGALSDGLYLREDVEVKCSITLMGFVKSQLKAASKLMVERIIKKAELVDSGVLHAMLDNGKLRTINPADRTSTMASVAATSPAGSPVPSALEGSSGKKTNNNNSSGISTTNSSNTTKQHQQQQKQQQQQQQQNDQPPSSPPPVPYQVPRPQSLQYPYGIARPNSTGMSPYPPPGSPGLGVYSPHPNYPAGVYPGYAQQPPHLQQAGYAGHPIYSPQQLQQQQQMQQMHPGMYAPPYGTPVQELQAHPPPPAGGSFAVEMPGDYYHGQNLAVPPPQPIETLPPGSRDSETLSSAAQWYATQQAAAQHQQYLQQQHQQHQQQQQQQQQQHQGSRPASTASESSGGMRSPPLEKNGASELATHRETQEEHIVQALKKLDPVGAAAQQEQSGYVYR